MRGKKRISLLLFICLSGGLLWLNPGQTLTPVRGFVWFLAEPVASALHRSLSAIGDVSATIGQLSSLRAENRRLYEEVAALRAEEAGREDVQSENDALRRELHLEMGDAYSRITAALIAEDPSGGEWLMIDKGERDGVYAGATVVAGGSVLVGSVEESFATSARVRLITSPKSVVNVRATKTEAKGVVRGQFGLGLLLDMVPQTKALEEGETLVTSELGSEILPGLLVGEVRSIRSSEDGLFRQASVLSPLRFEELRFVTVLQQQ